MAMTEADWLAQLKASPLDDVCQSAFCDWLEENGREAQAEEWRRHLAQEPGDCTQREGGAEGWVWLLDIGKRNKCPYAVELGPKAARKALLSPRVFEALPTEGSLYDSLGMGRTGVCHGFAYLTLAGARRALVLALIKGCDSSPGGP